MPSSDRRSRAIARLGVAAVVAAFAVVGVAPAPSGAQDPAADESKAVQVAIEMYENRAKLDEVNTGLLDAQARLAAAETALAETVARLTALQAQITLLRDELHGRAAQVYVQRGGDLATFLQVGRVVDLAAGERYTNAAAADGTKRLEQLAALELQAEQERQARDYARATIAEQKVRLEGLQAELLAATARDQALLDKLGGVPMMGDAKLTAAQLAAYFLSTGQRASLADGLDIEGLAQLYIEEGAAEHVRGDIAFAQSIIETGSFSHTRGNNYSGIGNCDSCGGVGMFFPTPRDGVRAQIQLLRNYADPTSRASNLANPPDATIYGSDPVAAAASYDSFFAKGRAPLWNVMGAGNWATDPFYAGKVLSLYQAMVGHAALHP